MNDEHYVHYERYAQDVYKRQEEYGAEVEGDSSFNYAGLHIITMNSNPWGLFQMNSEATGQKADAATIKTIDNAMNWLKKDLATDAATVSYTHLDVYKRQGSDYSDEYAGC